MQVTFKLFTMNNSLISINVQKLKPGNNPTILVTLYPLVWNMYFAMVRLCANRFDVELTKFVLALTMLTLWSNGYLC